jgi:hypothetical protein
MQPALLEQPHSQVLDVAAVARYRLQADDVRHSIILGVCVAVGDVALAAFLVGEDKLTATASRPANRRMAAGVRSLQITLGAARGRDPQTLSATTTS